jgi:hypothetical protein
MVSTVEDSPVNRGNVATFGAGALNPVRDTMGSAKDSNAQEARGTCLRLDIRVIMFQPLPRADFLARG